MSVSISLFSVIDCLTLLGLSLFLHRNTNDKSAPFQIGHMPYSIDYRLTLAYYHILYPLCLRNSLRSSYLRFGSATGLPSSAPWI